MNGMTALRTPALVLVLLPGCLWAGELQAHVTTPDGKPAPDAVVIALPVAGAPAPAPRGEPVVIAQKDIRFQPYVSAVPLGTTLRCVNRDRFDHPVRSLPGWTARLGGAAQGLRAASGRCARWRRTERRRDDGRLRPRALARRARGRRRHPWHPDQLVAQAQVRGTVAAAASVQAQLSFTPRRRPPPRKGEDED